MYEWVFNGLMVIVGELKKQILGCILRTNSQSCAAKLDHQGSCFFCNRQEAICQIGKPPVKLLAPETCSSVCLHQLNAQLSMKA